MRWLVRSFIRHSGVKKCDLLRRELDRPHVGMQGGLQVAGFPHRCTSGKHVAVSLYCSLLRSARSEGR